MPLAPRSPLFKDTDVMNRRMPNSSPSRTNLILDAGISPHAAVALAHGGDHTLNPTLNPGLLRATLAALAVSLALSGCGVFCGGAGGSGGGFAGGCAAGMRF
jgi:hypothetical protein